MGVDLHQLPLLTQFRKRFTIKQTANYVAIVLGYLAVHLLDGDLQNMWAKEIADLDSALRFVAAYACLLSSSTDVVDVFKPREANEEAA